MDKKTLKKLEEELKKTKTIIEKGLNSFAKKDENLKGDWDTKFPRLGEKGRSDLEKAADEVEEYETLLSIEHSLEDKLRDIDTALKKIKSGKYGICEKCKKPISIARLKVFPAAKNCKDCNK